MMTKRIVAVMLVATSATAFLVAAPNAVADPPTFTTTPSDVLAIATQAKGGVVDFPTPPATDDHGASNVSCLPASRNFFPVGTTHVSCTAVDVTTNQQSSVGFDVRVLAHPQERASHGATTALFYYTKTKGNYGVTTFEKLRLTIVRQGRVAFRAAVPKMPRTPYPASPAGYGSTRSVSVRDLDGDGEPEVLLDLYSGGAHCCFWTDVYRLAGASYSVTPHVWGDLTYKLRDLNGDGRPEFVSADDRFAYAFAAFAFSGFPLQIWSYAHGRFSDVSRRYPASIRADAARQWHYFLAAQRQHYETEGVLAAWAADEYLLRHRMLVWQRLGALGRAGALSGDYRPATYVRKLKRFLLELGYGR